MSEEIQISKSTTEPDFQVGMRALKAKGKTIVLQVPDAMFATLEGTDQLTAILNRLRRAGFADAVCVGESTKVTVKKVNSAKKLKITKKKNKIKRILE